MVDMRCYSDQQNVYYIDRKLNLVVWQSRIATAKIKICQYLIFVYVRMAIPYQTDKFKSANIFVIAIWGQTTKFNSHQYFWLYGILRTLAKKTRAL